MDRRSLIVIGVAVLLGIFAVIIANSWFTGVQEQQERVAEEQELARIVVASQDLEFGGPIANDTVRIANWPQQSVPTGAITEADFDRIMTGRNVAIRPIARGEPILVSRISDRAILSANLPENMRAVTVPINAVSGVAGFVFPGDVVDVFLTRQIPGDGAESYDQMTAVLLENVQVLAVDRRASENNTEPEVGGTATLQVDQLDAQKLTLAQKIGSLSFALRNVEDQEIGAVRVVTNRDLAGSNLFIGERRSSRSGGGGAPAPSGGSAIGATGASNVSVSSSQRSSSPSMLIYRGTEVTRQEVQDDVRY